MKVVLFDPSLKNNSGDPSLNLGDLVIYDSVSSFLKTKFKSAEIIRISTHTPINKRERALIKDSDLCFVGGTNLLSSDLKEYNQWKSNYYEYLIKIPVVKNAVLLGVGWWQYQSTPTRYTGMFYKNLLSSQYIHSVRDIYTKDKLRDIQVKNCLNTSCPSIWNLNGKKMDRRKEEVNDVLLMLTDYHPDAEIDNKLLNIILDKFSGNIYFFPQGSEDSNYIKSLLTFKQNQKRFKLLNHNYQELDALVKSDPALVYIGTRLHGGIKCIQHGISALILANDNRSLELGKDINLAVIKRNNFSEIIKWIEHQTNFGVLNLPIENIEKWKYQFPNI